MVTVIATILLIVGLAALATAIRDVVTPAIAGNAALELVFSRSSRVVMGVLLTGVGAALFLDLSWMQWTAPTAAFFIGLFSLLIVMTYWDRVSPTEHHQGFLPIPFSRGERLFLSFMTFFGVMGLWMAFLPEVSLYYGMGVAAVAIVVVAKFG
jgi:predicted small integral membrane protein